METIHVLAVDDEPFNLDLIELSFMDIPDIVLTKAINGKDAIEQLPSLTPDVILLDLRMPVMDGFETLKYIKNDSRFSNIPVIIVTANAEEKNKALHLGANDFIAKPIDTVELQLRTFNHAKLYKTQKELKELNTNLDTLVQQKTQQLEESLQHAKETEYEISIRLGRASEYRDLETGMHIKRMSHYSAMLGRLWGMSPQEEQLLLYSAPLHDIGKIGIPDAILLKPGKLNEEEFELMKEHASIGSSMLENGENYPIIKNGQIIAEQHHEKYDGTGYPKGLKGDAIHIYARIVAIADVFDALTSKRVYKDPFSVERAVSIMKKERSKHFDPALLDLFLENLELFLEIKEDFPDNDEVPHILSILGEKR